MSDDSTTRGNRLVGLIWGGQSLSLLLSGATTISLSLWVFAATNNAFNLSVIVAIKTLVGIYAAPLAGSIADIYSRRTLIALSNFGLAAVSVVLLLLTGSAGIGSFWAVALALVASGLLEGLLLVSLAASVRDIRKEANLTRVNGLISFLESAPLVVAPILGVILYQALTISGVLIVDSASFVVAGALSLLARWHTNNVSRSADIAWRLPFAGAVEGLRIIWRNPPFRSLQIEFSINNLFNGLGITAVTTFILTVSGGGSALLGAYNSVSALGLVVGAGLVAVIGPKLNRTLAVSGGLGVASLGGRILLGVGSEPVFWVLAAFLRSVGVQLSNAPLTAIWQESTPRDHQGKVFGARRLLGQGLYPFATLAGGAVAQGLRGLHVAAWLPVSGPIGLWLVLLGLGELAVMLYISVSRAIPRVSASSLHGLTLPSARPE